jgi:hypothetical protein
MRPSCCARATTGHATASPAIRPCEPAGVLICPAVPRGARCRGTEGAAGASFAGREWVSGKAGTVRLCRGPPYLASNATYHTGTANRAPGTNPALHLPKPDRVHGHGRKSPRDTHVLYILDAGPGYCGRRGLRARYFGGLGFCCVAHAFMKQPGGCPGYRVGLVSDSPCAWAFFCVGRTASSARA